MGTLSFGKEKRLLKPAHFETVFNNAIPAVTTHLTGLARRNTCENPRLGITISKKRVKLAKDRNRIKRIIREQFRMHAHELPNIDIILLGKSGLGSLHNDEIVKLLNNIWQKLKKRCAA